MLFGLRWGSLRAKIIAWSFVPTAIILVAVAVVIFYAYQQVTEDLVVERNRELTRLAAGQLAAELKEYADLLDAEARTSDIYGNDPVAQRDALKGASNRLAAFDAGVLILNTFGIVVAAEEPDRPEVLGQDWSDRSYYRQILHSQIRGLPEPVFSDIVADGPGGAEVIVIAVPITGPQGESVGTLAGMFRVGATRVSAFYGDIVKLRVGESGSAYLVDGQGQVIHHSDPDRHGEDFSAQEVVQQVLSGEVGADRTRDVDGREIVASFAPLPGTSWGLVTQESWAALTRASRGYRQFLILLLAMGVVVPALVVAVGIRRITRPISELIGAAQEVAGGNFGQTITARTGDEIEELAQQFSLMAAQLQELYAHLERRVADRTRELAALNAIAGVVSQSLDLEEVLSDALDETLKVMGIESGGIYLLDEEAGVLTVAAQQGFSPQFVAGIDNLKVGEGFSGRVAQSGQPLVVRNVSADPRLTRMVVREEGLRSLAIVPLSSRGKVLGTLFAITRGYREFTDQDVQLLTSIGQQIGIAIENARLFEAESRRRQEATLLAEMAKLISGTLDLDEVLRLAAQYAVDVFDVHCCCILLYDEGKGTLRPAAGIGFDDQVVAAIAEVEFSPSEAMRRMVFDSLQPLIVEDVPADPHLRPQDLLDLQSALVVPIEVGGRRLGAMELGTRPPRRRRFTAHEGELALALANQAAMAIENARLFKAEQRRAEQFSVISQVSRRTTSILAIDELLDQVTRLIQQAFNYDIVEIGLVEEDELVYKARAERDSSSPFESFRLKVGEQGITGWVAARGEPLLVPDVSQDPRFIQVTDTKTRSELAVPIKAKEKIIGVLNLQSEQLDAFDESDLAVTQSLADQAAIAIENARLFQAEQHRAEQFRVISEVDRRITSILAPDELLGEIVRLVKETLGYYMVGIGLIEGDEVVFKAGAGPLWEDPQFHRPRLKVGREGITGWVAQSGEPLLVPDVSQEPRYYFVPQAGDTRSELAVPLKTKETLIGVLDVQSRRLNDFDESDLVLLQSLAHQAAIAIENARLYEDTKSRLAQLTALQETTRAVASTLEPEKLLSLITQQATTLLQADGGILNLVDWENHEDEVVAGTGSAASALGYRSTLEGSLSGWVALHNQPLISSQLQDDSWMDRRPDSSLVERMREQVQSAAIAPLTIKGQVMGTLVVMDKQGGKGEFDQSDLNLLVAFASQAATAIENARLYEQAQEAAVMQERHRLARELHDAVTQTLFSASLMAEVLPALWESDQDEGRQLLKELRQLSRGALAEMRTLLLELRPAALVEAGLADLLRQLAEAVTGRTGMPVTVTVEGECELPDEVHVALYRIAQEALNNVVKHAHASQVAVSLCCVPPGGGVGKGGSAELRVSDDGTGFDPSRVPPDRLGLGIMRERARAIGATLRIESEIRRGTEVMVVWTDLQEHAEDG